MMQNKRQILKVLVVLAFSFLWFLIALGRVMRPVLLNIGVDCLMGLVATFQQGSISGRDFHYTYGPVAQLLAWAGASLNGYAFDGFGLGVLAWDTTAIFLFGAIVLFIADFSPVYIALIYVVSFALDLLGWFPYSDVASFRVLFILVSVMAVGKSLASETAAGRRLWAGIGGLLCLVGQLTTIELGLYAATAATLLSIGYMVRSWAGEGAALRDHLETLSLALGIYAGGNLLISGYFYFSGEHYAFWDYQRYALETIKGYVYGSTWPWQLDRWQTAGVIIVTIYTVAAVWKVQRRLNPSDRAVILGMAIVSLLCLKSTLIRSDANHIKAGMTPMVLVFLALGWWILPKFASPGFHWKPAAVWTATLSILFFAWPWPPQATPLTDLMDGARWLRSGGLAQLRHSRTMPQSLLPPEVIEELRDSDSRPMLNFPFENHIAALLNRRQLAPVLQSFAANTVELQRYYVESINRPAHGDIDVTYSLDRAGWWPVDGVQTISRNPIIFEYLHRNFELRLHSGGMAVLRRSEEPRRVAFDDLAFQAIERGPHTTEIRLAQPVRCGLVRLEVEAAYPAVTALLKPSLIGVRVLKDSAGILSGALIPLAVGRPFYTFLSVAPPEQFFKVFGYGNIPAPE
ncbi:MAG: hypothetical protein HY648_10660, partial [Acidobacteria bacterium]|nr:hypothetical protein [Acidobacteriota bacterium]